MDLERALVIVCGILAIALFWLSILLISGIDFQSIYQIWRFRRRFRAEDVRRRHASLREANSLIGTGYVAPDTNQIWGIDISAWDGNVNLQVTRDYGASFVLIKCMDGTIESKYWRANNERAKVAGLLNGAYTWLYPDSKISCTLQARAVYNLIVSAGLRLPLVVDFEWTRYAGAAANPNYVDLDKFVTEYTRLSGEQPILYSAAGYMNMFGPMPAALIRKFSGFWFASYGGTKPVYPYGFSSYDLWQFTAFGDAQTLATGDTGKKELDLNYMTESFYSRYAVEPPPIATGAPMKGTVLLGYTLNIRNASNTVIGTLRVNDVVYGNMDNNRIYYSKIYRANGTLETPGGVCSSAVSNGATPIVYWMKLENIPEPTPAPVPATTPFTLTVDGYKPYSGQLEKE